MLPSMIELPLAGMLFHRHLGDTLFTIMNMFIIYPPSERSELARYHVILFPSFRPSVRTQYLDANISKTVWVRDLVPITH